MRSCPLSIMHTYTPTLSTAKCEAGYLAKKRHNMQLMHELYAYVAVRVK